MQALFNLSGYKTDKLFFTKKMKAIKKNEATKNVVNTNKSLTNCSRRVGECEKIILTQTKKEKDVKNIRNIIYEPPVKDVAKLTCILNYDFNNDDENDNLICDICNERQTNGFEMGEHLMNQHPECCV
jgi:hypothetical protein